MNIIDLMVQDGFNPIRVASTNGGEWHSSCYHCGGNDRFLIWPFQKPEKGGHFYCRQCKKSGDAITYLMQFRNLKYKEACLELGITPDFKFNAKPETPERNTQPWEPRTINQVSQQWSNKAEAVLFHAYKLLMAHAGQSTREYLSERGIPTDCIKQARLGLIQSDLSFDRESWGLPSASQNNAKNHQIWIPAGIIIPMFAAGRVVRLRIRQDNPKKSDRYILVAGSATAYLQHNPEFNPANPTMVVESELDGWLIHQSAGSLINIFSIGNSSARPDIETHQKLRQTPVLISLDHDQAGKKECEWWRKNYSNSMVWPSLSGKDPGEDFKAGTDIESWVRAGIDEIAKIQKPVEAIAPAPVVLPPVAKQEKQIEAQPEQIEIFKQTTICLHNKHCQHLSQQSMEYSQIDKPCCLLRENRQVEEATDNLTSIFFMSACPKGFWKKIKSGGVSEIIIL